MIYCATQQTNFKTSMSILRIGQHYTSGKQNKQVQYPHQHATHHHSRLRRTKNDGEYEA